MRFAALAVLLVFFTGLHVAAQAAPPTTVAPKKAKKVFTDDDVRRLSGGISVVGDSEKKSDGSDDENSNSNQPKTKTAKEPTQEAGCLSRSWATMADVASRSVGVNLGNDYWHQKLFGHDICTDQVGTPDSIARAIDGGHIYPDGTHARLKVKLTQGMTTAAALIAAQREGRTPIMVWKHHPYAVDGGNYINYGKNAVYVIKDIALVDPYTRDHEFFVKGKNDLSEIDATLEVSADK
jgi:hypothetical protein